jgi:hypothetical protein
MSIPSPAVLALIGVGLCGMSALQLVSTLRPSGFACQHAPCRVRLCCIFEGMIAARFHKLVVVVEVAGERQVLFS